MTLGEMIKQYCDDHAMSMQDFANRSGLSKAYVGMLIKGINPSTGKPVLPTIRTYQQAADAMSIPLSAVLGKTQKDVPTHYVEVKEPPKQDRYRELADAIVERLREEDDDEAWQIRQDMKDNPELRALWSLGKGITKSEMAQLQAFIKAIRSTGNENSD